jgi:hypothetical protein
MQAKTKSGLILGSTLLIGALFGALLFGWFVRDRMRHIPHPRHFSHRMERMIEPQDEAQQVALREILMRYQDKLWDIDIAHREGLKAHMDAVLAELRPILSEEQFRRVERRRRRLGELMGPWRDGRRNRQRE